MRIVIIGGSGHIGTYLVPRLAEAGHEIVNISRGASEPYQPHGAWCKVRRIVCDRSAEDAAGIFGARVADLQPDAVIDLICFAPESASQLVEALRGKILHFLHCGTIWVHGPSTEEAHSTLAVVPGSRFVHTSRPFCPNEAITGACPEAVAPAKASSSTPLRFLNWVVFMMLVSFCTGNVARVLEMNRGHLAPKRSDARV